MSFAALRDYPHWGVVILLTLFSAIGALEGLGIANKHFVTVTAIICAVIPAWARAMILGWLVYHFLIQHK